MNYSKGDTVFSYWHINDGPVVKFSISEILAKSEFVGPLYIPRTNRWFYVIGLGIVLVVFGVYLWIKKSKKTKAPLLFNSLEIKLLQALMHQEVSSPLSTNEINDILELSDKSLENQRRIRMNIINQVNQKIALFFKVDKAIERIASHEDKRLILHKLNPEVVKHIKDYL